MQTALKLRCWKTPATVNILWTPYSFSHVDGKNEYATHDVMQHSCREHRIGLWGNHSNKYHLTHARMSQDQTPALMALPSSTDKHSEKITKIWELREEALDQFRFGHCPILVDTAGALRCCLGDLPHVKHVLNYDLPGDIEEFIQCIAYTGRDCHPGLASSVFHNNNANIARGLQDLLFGAEQEVP